MAIYVRDGKTTIASSAKEANKKFSSGDYTKSKGTKSYKERRRTAKRATDSDPKTTSTNTIKKSSSSSSSKIEPELSSSSDQDSKNIQLTEDKYTVVSPQGETYGYSSYKSAREKAKNIGGALLSKDSS